MNHDVSVVLIFFFFYKATFLTKLKWCSQMCKWNMFMDCVYGIVLKKRRKMFRLVLKYSL